MRSLLSFRVPNRAMEVREYAGFHFKWSLHLLISIITSLLCDVFIDEICWCYWLDECLRAYPRSSMARDWPPLALTFWLWVRFCPLPLSAGCALSFSQGTFSEGFGAFVHTANLFAILCFPVVIVLAVSSMTPGQCGACLTPVISFVWRFRKGCSRSATGGCFSSSGQRRTGSCAKRPCVSSVCLPFSQVLSLEDAMASPPLGAENLPICLPKQHW